MRRILEAFGLVTRGSYEALRAQQERTRAKVHELRGELRAARREVASARHDARDLQRRADKQLQMAEQELRKAAAIHGRAERVLADRHERLVNLDKLGRQIKDSRHLLDGTREYVMATEVKLDVLEGAANVLERRIRKLDQAG